MRESDLCAGLSHQEIAQLAGMARIKRVTRRDVLFHQGEQSRQIFLIESGSVKLTQLGSSGNEVILWMRGVGSPVGVLGALSHEPQTCSAKVIVSGSVMLWDWSALENSFSGMVQLRKNVARILSEQLGELEERFREIATEKVHSRVAKALSRIVRQVGTPHAVGVEVFLSREELSQVTGTTLFTVSRLISRWAERKIVAPKRESLVVLDMNMLANLCREDN